MNMKSAIIVLSALTSLSVFADQQPAPTPAYQEPVARLLGHVTCSIGLQDKSFDCTLHAAGKGTMNVDMMEIKKKDGTLVGYYGMDKFSEAGTNYSMIVEADANHGVVGMSMVTDTQGANGTSFEASMVSTSASSIRALNISPLKIDMSDMNAIKVDVGFSLYAKPQAAIMQAGNSQDVINMIIERLTPYLLTLKK